MSKNAKSPQRVPSRKRTPARVFCRRFIEPGEITKALKLVARTNPEVFLKLVSSIPVAETPARSRIELAG
jgi:hypothetical protein